MTHTRAGPAVASDPITGVAHLLGHPFLQHAVTAGTAIAVLSGLVGYFVVLRGQVFAGDALSHVAYAGALAALAAGVDLRIGLFAATIAVLTAVTFSLGPALGVTRRATKRTCPARGAAHCFAKRASPPCSGRRTS